MPVLNLDAGSQLLFQPGSGSVTVINLSSSDTVYVATTPTVHDTDIPIGPGASMTFDGTQWWYGSALDATVQVAVVPGGTSFFLPASLANLGGSKVYVQDTAPSGNIPLNSVWFDTADGSLQTWDGTDWVNEQFNAQELIQAATILGTQIAAQAITAGNVADGTLTTAQLAAAAGILGTQIAAATVTSSNIAAHTIVAANIAANTITAAEIAANTITAGQIQANTITASQLAAGIIYAGIINGTTVSAATFSGSVFEGTDFIINTSGAFWYSAAPAKGNLIASIAAAAGTDGFGNKYSAGINTYGTSVGLAGLEFFGGGNPAGLRMVPDNAPATIFSDPGIASFSDNTGTAQYTGAALESGEIASGAGVSTVTAYGGSADGTTSIPHVQVNGGPAGSTMLADISQKGIILSPATQSWLAAGSKTDTTSITMGNVTSPDQITVPYTIDSPLAPGTVYELHTEFSGTWGNQLLSFYADISGSFTVPLAVIGAAFGSAGNAYNGWIRLIVRITSATACHVHVQGGMANTALNSGHLLDGSNTLDITSAPTSGTPIAAGDNISIAAAWGGSATQNLTTFGSTCTRSGNP